MVGGFQMRHWRWHKWSVTSFLGSLVYYQASHYIDTERSSLFLFFVECHKVVLQWIQARVGKRLLMRGHLVALQLVHQGAVVVIGHSEDQWRKWYDLQFHPRLPQTAVDHMQLWRTAQ